MKTLIQNILFTLYLPFFLLFFSSCYNTGTIVTNDLAKIAVNTTAIPSGLTLTSPAVSPGFDRTPTLSISGVAIGDTVKLFTDSACSTAVGSVVSSAATDPWLNITQVTAKAKCKDIGGNYDLISNPEWMAIARNVENVDSNWTDSAVGAGCLKRGNVGSVLNCA